MGSGELPEGWVCAEIGDVTERAEKIDPRNTPDRIIRYIDISSIDNKRFRIAGPSIVKLSEAPSRARQLIREGDTLFSLVRPYLKNIAFVDASLDGEIASTGFCVLRSNGALDPKFLFYRAISQDFVNSLSEGQYGVSYPAVNEQQVRAQLIAVAPLNEQRRIVEKIEALFAELDKGEESLRQVQKLLARYRQSVLKAAVTGELTADWRARHAGNLEHGRDLLARILKARRENWQGRGKYKEPVEPDTSSLPELPEGWVWATVGQIADVIGGLTKNSKRVSMPLRRPMLRVANVYQNRLDLSDIHETGLTESELERALLKPLDLLVVEGNGSKDQIGRMALWRGEIPGAVHQNHLIKVRLIEKGMVEFLLWWFQSPDGRQMIEMVASSSSGLHTLSISKIESFAVPLPSLDEAQEITSQVREALLRIEQLNIYTEAELRRSAALRRSILKDAFVGRLVPQDPTEEPATELIARIRAQRSAEPHKSGRRKLTA